MYINLQFIEARATGTATEVGGIGARHSETIEGFPWVKQTGNWLLHNRAGGTFGAPTTGYIGSAGSAALGALAAFGIISLPIGVEWKK